LAEQTSERALAARILDGVPLPSEVATGEAAVSVWCGPVGGPARYTRDADRPHDAASVMKMAILLAVDAAGQAADEHVEITDVFTGRDGSRVRAERSEDNDEEPWRRLGGPATLRWLAERAIISSSNLASNLLIERLGLDAVRAQCPPGLRVDRQIGDVAAREAGITNSVTVTAAAALLGRCAELAAVGRGWPLGVLARQRYRDGIWAGLPGGTTAAGKGGWVTGARHDCAVITPSDAPPYVLAVCTTGLPDDRALPLIRAYAAASWQIRGDFPAPAMEG
jgi:beta-lactamase class A